MEIENMVLFGGVVEVKLSKVSLLGLLAKIKV
jgi:hypothetical protein